MAVLMWCLPRRLGVVGLFGAQFLSLVAWTLVLYVSISTGEVYYDGLSTFAGIVFDTILFNCVLLPASVAAAWLRHREWRAQRSPDTAAPHGKLPST
jgi:hypothetical protein